MRRPVEITPHGRCSRPAPVGLAQTGGTNAAILFAVFSIGLLGVVGVGIDVSRATAAKSQLQRRLDTALAAGVLQHSDPERLDAAETVFDENATGSIGAVRARRFEAGRDELIGMASADVPLLLSSLVGMRSLDVQATGRAEIARSAP
jgi:hypothetical protein